jgi:hypothetical protein
MGFVSLKSETFIYSKQIVQSLLRISYSARKFPSTGTCYVLVSCQKQSNKDLSTKLLPPQNASVLFILNIILQMGTGGSFPVCKEVSV